MRLDSHFDKFHSNVKLNPEREKRIRAAYSHLEEFVKNDGPLSEILIDLFPQGSVAINTAIRPLEEGREFDADAVLVLDVAKKSWDKQTPEAIIAWVANRLRQDPLYEGKVSAEKRCVRITFSGDFHLDVVPARPVAGVTGVIEVPDKEEGRWRRSNPKGYITWALNVDKASGGKFNRIVKMLKRWRDLKFGEESAPKSILFTTLIGNHMAIGYSSDADALVPTMEALRDSLEKQYVVPIVSNPSLPEENLARDWTQEHFELFKERFKTATAKARAALNEEDKEKSIKMWQDIFGDAFPKLTEEDAKRVAEAVKAGTAFVGSTGRVSVGNPHGQVSTKIQEHRFYGDESRKPK